MNNSNHKGVFVFVEQREGQLQKVSLELIGKANEIAGKLGEKVTAVVLGSGIESMCDELIHYGAHEVLYVDHPMLSLYATEPYAKAITGVIEDKKPEIMLIGATTIGRDLAPRVSARVHTGLTADCTSLDIDDETRGLLMTRPAFGGNIMATIICPDHRPQMSTVRPGVMQMLEKDEGRKGVKTSFAVDFSEEDMNIEILEQVKEKKQKINIEDATVLVSGGRGIGSAENFKMLKELSENLGGMVSASRAVVDSGWLDRDHQVGQTGKTVRPDLYIACGISGAIQHIAGMEDSELIVAINKDPQAPIFEVADVGIVGDVGSIIPELIEQLNKASGK